MVAEPRRTDAGSREPFGLISVDGRGAEFCRAGSRFDARSLFRRAGRRGLRWLARRPASGVAVGIRDMRRTRDKYRRRVRLREGAARGFRAPSTHRTLGPLADAGRLGGVLEFGGRADAVIGAGARRLAWSY